ncbi:YihY/virulence factor BrkB family protein [PVC group bacterium]|nr:YihY/virulence factor BrkB family protein [PVC group bacterium]
MIVRLLRTIVIAFRGFKEDKCQLRASALTFYSLMSVVPVFAMAFGIAKGFGFERLLETWMIENFQGQEEVVGRVIEFARSLLDNAKGGLISGIGIIILFWVVMKVLGNIEHSFNDIWGVKKGRTFARKVADYLSIMLICPVLFIMASSLSVIVASQIKQIIISNNFLGTLNPIVLPALKLIPLGTIWFLFTFLYIFLPNTKVKFSSGLIAGIVAGTMYFALQMGYIKFQIGVAKMGAIYGSFAALPLFLIWVQLSWLIVLLGAELSFASQNVDTYEFEPDCLSVSNSYKKLLTLRITSLLVKNFHLAKASITANQISHELEIPIRLVRQILFELVGAGILTEAQNGSRAPVYQPGRDIHDMSIQKVLTDLERRGTSSVPVLASNELERLKASLEGFHATLQSSKDNILLKDL